MSLEPIKPDDYDELKDFQEAQAGRIRAFLAELAKDDGLLHDYIEDRVSVLQRWVDGGGLFNEDVALLLDSDYSRVYEVMSKGSQPMRWLVIWIV
ncbi:MAG TPA: hypothetical protein VFN33_07235 [Gaiellaceae bacterium]|nr:hypothetical protein [Gaiellaceae bacterium]